MISVFLEATGCPTDEVNRHTEDILRDTGINGKSAGTSIAHCVMVHRPKKHGTVW